ncbi:MAG: trypsin-like peptidase domain-containing protein [Bryobacterales bacterium]|nr:trypsin-like peptidase domain-containing protein [Bryobacterales bacterium]
MPNALSYRDRAILQNALSDTAQFATVRGRQAIVRNALAGYPLSGEIDKALRWVDWEGSSFVVADDLLRLLEGHEAAPGLAALALIAQAIEPMAGVAHRERIADLRRRMGWGAVDPASLPAESWRDQRPAAEVAQERIIGENTLKPMYYLRRALVAADAVVRVDLSGQPMGTGFLVAPDIMMTNHHVIGNEEQARCARAVFFLEVPDPENNGELTRKEALASAALEKSLRYTNKQLDVSLLRLENSPRLQRYFPLRPAEMKQNDRVVIIQHPGGYPKQISLQNNLVAHADARIVQYYTSTKAGSSGSPVLDDNFAVIAIHHGWVHNQAWDSTGQVRVTGPKEIEDSQYRNEGTSVIALLEDLEKTAPDLLSELTVLPG